MNMCNDFGRLITSLMIAATACGLQAAGFDGYVVPTGGVPHESVLIHSPEMADGEVVIPIDVEAFGFWLKAAFGQPVTTGTTPKTHTFQSGNWTLPSLAIETAMPEVPRFAMYSGCVLDQLS
mgnify:CR=1 FL=1